MWHEARKQEKKIRGMMVDYKRRAERRRDYYERIKQDPAQFLQVHGRPTKIHLDPAVAAAADSPATMMPWQGNQNNMIDRFDVRAHLDIIPEFTSPAEIPKPISEDDRKACYERYRTLVQNDFMGVNEDKFLHQIFLEERFGPVLKPAGEEEKKKLMDKKVAIGYIYEDSTTPETPMIFSNPVLKSLEEEEDDDEKDDLSDIDLDITVDVSELSAAQCAEMNEHSHKYGMVDDDFITYLLQDKDEADQLRLVKEIEEEKAMFSGRKSRRERRALREKKLAGRKITSPPSYAARDSPTYRSARHSTSKSRSRSQTPPNSGKITFITSFGGEVSDMDHHDKKLAGPKSSKDVSHKKCSKESRSGKDIPEIGPQLPDRSDVDKKNRQRSSHRRSRSSSISDRGSRRDSKKSYTGSRYRSNRSRRSSSSRSASRSRSRSRSKKKHNSRQSYSRNSRSHSASSRSRSRSSPQPPKSSAKSRSRSRSRSVKKSASPNLPPPPVKSYYRHSLSRSSSDLSDDSNSQEHMEDSSSGVNTSLSLSTKIQQLTGKAGPTTKSKLTPQERLKRKMQLALNKQYKADKRAQMEKTEKLLQERMDRAEELREMAIKLRQRERERRHRLRGYDRDSDSDSSLIRGDLSTHDEDIYMNLKEHKAESPVSDSSSSKDAEYSKNSDSKRSYEDSHVSRHSSLRSPSRDHKYSSSSSQPFKKSESRRSPSRRSPPRKSPPRTSRQRSPHRYSGGGREERHSEMWRQPPRSPYRHPIQHSNRRERRERSPCRSQNLRSRNSRPLVDY